jgi:hypothetical protein
VLMELSDKLLVLFALLDMFLGLMTFCECRWPLPQWESDLEMSSNNWCVVVLAVMPSKCFLSIASFVSWISWGWLGSGWWIKFSFKVQGFLC